MRLIRFQDAINRSQIDAEHLSFFNGIYVFEAEDIGYSRERFGREASFLPLAFDPEVYPPQPEVSRDLDLVFVGTFYPDQRALFEWLNWRFPDLQMRINGRHVRYREPSAWRAWAPYQIAGQETNFVNRSLQPAEINHAYARARLCLNLHHAQSRLGRIPRVFEIPGAGGAQLVHDLPCISEEVQTGVLSYREQGNLAELIESYLSDQTGRDLLAERGRQLSMDAHTFAHCAQVLLDRHGLPGKTKPVRSVRSPKTDRRTWGFPHQP